MAKKVEKETIIRTVILTIALLNSILVMSGKNPLPFADDELYLWLSTVATIITSLIAWWKNNSFTQEAIQADEYLEELRAGIENDEEAEG